MVELQWYAHYQGYRVIAFKSITALENYGKGLLIVVDNHSTDGSYEYICNFLDKLNIRHTMVRTRRSLGGIDNTRYLIDELLITHPIKHIDEPLITPSYLSSALAVYRTDALIECGFRNKLFFDVIPAYFDDVVLGLKLWNCGYSLASLPVKIGLHLHGATFSRCPRYRVFNALVAWRALEEVVNTRFKNILPLVRYKVLARFLILYGLHKTFRAALEGIRLGKLYGSLLRRRGLHLDLYWAPYMRVDYRRLARLSLTVKLGF